MAFTQQLVYEPLRSIDSTTLSGGYQAIGTPLAHPATIIKMVNNSTSLVTISVNGTSDADVLPGTSFWLYDVTANTPMQGDPAIFIAEGTQYFVKGSAGTGLIYLVVMYIVLSSHQEVI